MVLNGTYFDGRISTAVKSEICYDGFYLSVNDDNYSELIKEDKYQVKIKRIIGSSKISFEFPNGEVFESEKEVTPEFENLYSEMNQPNFIISFLENNLYVVYLALILFVCTMYIGYTTGIPYLAEQATKGIPVSVLESIDEQTISIFTSNYFTSSEIDGEKQTEVLKIFREVANNSNSDYSFNLIIKNSESLGANAFALPGGTVIITDDLINLADTTKDLTGIFAHEIGHIENRHGVRSIIQNTGVLLVMSTIFGDYSNLATISTSIPFLLIQTGYSRDFEREADLFAANYLMKTEGSTESYEKMLNKLSETHDSEYNSFLSTHPAIPERITIIKNLNTSL